MIGILPEEPNSDGWMSFGHDEEGEEGPLTLSSTCTFRLSGEGYANGRLSDPAAINLIPTELEVDLSWEAVNLGYQYFVHSKPPEEEARAYEALAAAAAQRAASGGFEDAGPAAKPEPLVCDEFQKIAKIWSEVAANEVSEESRALVQSRLDLFHVWTLLADQVVDNAWVLADRRIRIDVQRLLKLVLEGDEKVGNAHYDLVITLIHQMNMLREIQGEMVDRMARWRVRWPALTAAHPSFRLYDDPPESLGSGYPFRMDKGSRWQPAKDSDQVALHLAFFMHRLKFAVTRFAEDKNLSAECFDSSLQDVMALKALPEAVQDWWRAAEWHFLREYPKPETNFRFEMWLTAPSHRKSPKEMRRRIMERLQQSFVSVLGGNKLR